jgi:hypothetical protein
VGFINWFRETFRGVLIFAIPNGDHRAISVARRLKSEGVVKGVPDLFIPDWCVWVEMKRQKGGKLSDEQSAIIDYLESIGHDVVVGYGARDASEKLLTIMKARTAR